MLNTQKLTDSPANSEEPLSSPGLTRPLPAPSKSLTARYVQYGCSWSAPEGWTNFDSSFTLKWERLPLLGRYTKNSTRFPDYVLQGDIVEGLPVPDESCLGVYASHVLEHLTLEDFHKALDNTYRILSKGGIFRLIVPDLERAAREYVANLDRGQPDANATFLKETHLGKKSQERGFMGLGKKLFNTSSHLWMWDKYSMSAALAGHGFQSIRPCSFGDCEDPMFSIVEDKGRFDKAVAIEARR